MYELKDLISSVERNGGIISLTVVNTEFRTRRGIQLRPSLIQSQSDMSRSNQYMWAFPNTNCGLLWENSLYYNGTAIFWYCDADETAIRRVIDNLTGSTRIREDFSWTRLESNYECWVADECFDLFEKELDITVRDNNKRLQKIHIDRDTLLSTQHQINIKALHENYMKLFRRDNGIKEDEGCFITTAVCSNFGKPDDCYELEIFRNFRDNWLANQIDGSKLIEEYYRIAPSIVQKINSLPNASKIYQSILEKYLAPCLRFIKSGDNFSCRDKYIEMVNSLKKKFLS